MLLLTPPVPESPRRSELCFGGIRQLLSDPRVPAYPCTRPQARGSRRLKRRPKVTCRSSRPEYDEQGRVSPETHRAEAERRLVLANQRDVSGVSGPQRLHLPSCGLRLGHAAANAPRRHAPAAHLCKPMHSVQFGHVRRLRERCVALGTARDAAVPPPTGPVQLRCGTQARTQTVSWCCYVRRASD